MNKIDMATLEGMRAYIQAQMSDINEGMDGSEIVRIAGIVVDPEWVATQDWYQEGREYDPRTPGFLVRAIELSNTGWNWALIAVDGGYEIWNLEELGNPPAYQGCYDYDDEENMISDPEGLAWVDELYEDCEDVYM